MCLYYNATSLLNANKIEKEGFKLGPGGIFGFGINFAKDPIEAIDKSVINSLNAIIIVNLDVGRLKTEEIAHNNWNFAILNKLGYDTVQMTCCLTGVEICVSELKRIKILSIAY